MRVGVPRRDEHAETALIPPTLFWSYTVSFIHRAYGIFNILLAVFFAAQIVWSRLRESSDPGSFVFWTVLAVGCLVAGIGYSVRVRWVVALGAVPTILLSLFTALTSLVGGWIWGPRESGTMSLLVIGGFGFAFLQLFGLAVTFLQARRRPENQTHTDQQSP